MALPTVTMKEISEGLRDCVNATVKKVLEGILNDHMDLLYGKETPYTTGKQILPTGTTIGDIDTAKEDTRTEQKFRDIFGKISATYHSADLKPQSVNDGTWDPKFKPVLVFITPDV